MLWIGVIIGKNMINIMHFVLTVFNGEIITVGHVTFVNENCFLIVFFYPIKQMSSKK